MRTLVLSLAAALALGACDYNVQTSSGADYLARYDAALPATAEPDAAIRRAAAVEPILTFPARFGIARIENGRLTGIPAAEVALWTGLIEKHRSLGEFAPISPIIAEFTADAVLQPRAGRDRRDTGELVTTIRLGAARQHVDAVLIYEVGATSGEGLTFLAFADLTIIGGAFLPTRSLEARGVASALLLDVRNGYPYGTASAEADLSALSVTYGSDRRTEELRREAALKVVGNLVPEVDAMFGELVVEMAKRSLPAD
jgi:hypothetical protein